MISQGQGLSLQALQFGRRPRVRASMAALALALGVGGTACSKEPEKQPEKQPDSTVATQPNPANIADTFVQTRNTLVTELNSLGSPTAVSNLDTDQTPGMELPPQGFTSWDMGDHHYLLEWDIRLDQQPPGYTAIATIADASGQQIKVTEDMSLDGQGRVNSILYTGPDGQTIPVTDPDAFFSADQLVDTVATVSKAASGMEYTPEADWTVGMATPDTTTAPSSPPPSAPVTPPTSSPPPADSSTPTEPPAPSTSPTEEPGPTGKNVKSFTLMTQNLWNIIHARAVPHWQERMQKVAEIAHKNNVEILTTQEGSEPQVKLLKDKLGKQYKSFPAKYTHKQRVSERTTFYKAFSDDGKPLWQLKNDGILMIPNIYDPGIHKPTRPMPWGRFVHAQTGQEMVIINIHAVAWDEKLDSGGALKREESAHIIAKWVGKMQERFPNAMVVASGDFNGRDYFRIRDPHQIANNDNVLKGDRSRLLPCILTAESDLMAVDDLAAGKKKGCPPSNRRADHAYTTGGGASKFRWVYRGQSDHAAMLAEVDLLQDD